MKTLVQTRCWTPLKTSPSQRSQPPTPLVQQHFPQSKLTPTGKSRGRRGNGRRRRGIAKATQVSQQGRRYERTSHMSLERCQLLRLQVLHQWNATMDIFCPTKTHSLSSCSLSLPSPGPKEPFQRLWIPQSVLCTGQLWGQGTVLCIEAVKGSDLSSTVLEAKSLNLLLGQTPLGMTAECGLRTDCSV